MVSIFVVPSLALSIMTSHAQPAIPKPSPRQLAWHEKPYYAFCHFGPNTFLSQEWGTGKEDPRVFNPTQFDARQWCRTFKAAGMTGVIITAKHHDGFCLWPSQYSKHTVRESNWRGGKGDVLKDLSAACKEFGLRFGVYVSPWDRNHPQYGTPEYNQTFAAMLKEVLTQYGEVFEVWFDGANGEGPNGKRQVYDWELFHKAVRQYAPKAVIFSDAGPDIRWVGNEAGYAGETNWSMVDSSRYEVATPLHAELQFGQESGDVWRPAECDVSIRPGWFFAERDNAKVKSVAKLVDIYLGSVGRNGNLLLNVPPDNRGLIHENDIKSLMGLKKWVDDTEATSKQSKWKTTSTQVSDIQVRVDSITAKPEQINLIRLRESIRNGQLVKQFTIEAEVNGTWSKIAEGTTVGNQRWMRFPAIQTSKTRITLTGRLPMVKGHIAVDHMATPEAAQEETQAMKDKRLGWWREARFGMFIHWGLYAIPAGDWKGKTVGGAGEWLIHNAGIPPRDWEPLKDQFNPTKFNADQWVKIAKDAGMKYIVITSKHHEGFALWDSKVSDFDVMATPFKRDILKELSVACKKAGIRLCFYHSILDWHHPDYLPRPKWDDRPIGDADFDRYVRYMKAQLKELVSGDYGDVGVLWFDGEWEERWNAVYGRDVYAFLRGLDKDLIINNRVGKGRAGMAGFDQGEESVGDFGTPEQEIPASGMPGVDWESCMTMNDTWGFKRTDLNWKSAAQLVQNLVDCASKGGNYLLNVGPTALGEIPEVSVERLATMGKWLDQNGESVYGTVAGPFERQPNWGRVTRKGDNLYCHVFDPGAQEFELTGFEGNIKRVSELGHDGGGSLMIRTSKRGPMIPMPRRTIDSDFAGLPRVFVVETDGKFTVTLPPLTVDANGGVELQALDAKVAGHSARFEAEKQCIGFWTNQKDRVEWVVDFPKPGEFDLELEFACADGSEGAQVEVSVATSTVPFKVYSTKGWGEFQRVSLGKIAVVSAGKHKVVVTPTSMPNGAVMNLRRLTFKPRS